MSATLLTALAAVAAYFGINQVTAWKVLEPYKWPLVGVSITLVVALGGWLLYRRLRRFRPNFGPLHFDFLLVRKEIRFLRDQGGQVRYSKKCRLRALKNGLDTYRDKYHWTGVAANAPRSLTLGQPVTLTVRKNIWQFYEVRLERTLNRGEEVDVELEWTLDDSGRTATPFFSATIEEPTLHLVLHLQLPPSLGIARVNYEVSNSIGAGRPFQSSVETLDTRGQITKEVVSPALFLHYEINWMYL